MVFWGGLQWGRGGWVECPFYVMGCLSATHLNCPRHFLILFQILEDSVDRGLPIGMGRLRQSGFRVLTVLVFHLTVLASLVTARYLNDNNSQGGVDICGNGQHLVLTSSGTCGCCVRSSLEVSCFLFQA